MRGTSIIHLTKHGWRNWPERRALRPDGSTNQYPARPEGCDALVFRIRAAWLVFTGRADALKWPEGQ